MPFYPTKSGRQVLVDMVNALRGTAYTADDFTYGQPQAVVRDDGRNTSIEMTVATGILTGSKFVLHYKRLDLAQLLTPRNFAVEDQSEFITYADMAEALSGATGFVFASEDFLTAEITRDTYPFDLALEANPDSLLYLGTGTVQMDEAPAPPVPITAPAQYDAYGLNGVLYIVGPSATPMVSNGAFTSVNDETMQGYQFGPAKFAKLIADTLYIDFNYAGYASDYSGTLDNVKLYGCDPVTGAIVETINVGQVAWDYHYVDNPLDEAPTLNPALVWRGELTLNITSIGGDPPMTETIDLVVGQPQEFPDFDILAIDGVSTGTGHPIPTPTYHANALSVEDNLTSIIYSTSSYPLADGPHTVTVKFGSVEHELEFEMVGT